LTVHDVRGRVVRRLPAEGVGSGPRETRWDGRDGSGRVVAAGIYFVVLRLEEETWTRKVLLVR
ncbi:hypothetical protein K8I85_07870, partial [bacterium]|nr:hypothetical protein [bacterium]